MIGKRSRPAWGGWIEIGSLRQQLGWLAVPPRMGRVD